MIQLPVPYRSQWGAGADAHSADCGPTCVAMILGFKGIDISPDGVYGFIQQAKKSEDFTNFNELIEATRGNHVTINYTSYEDQKAAFANLRANLDAGSPAIALVSYKPWRATLGNLFDFGHFVVVTGYDDGHIFIHDPLFGLWVKPAEKGAHYAMPVDLFAAGWGGCAVDGNTNWSCAYAGQVITVGQPAPPAPEPAPVPTPEPVPSPVVTPMPPPPPPPPPAPTGQTMSDMNRRIRALAAYRWAAPPDFNNPDELKLWLDHIGDWGLAYDAYVVRSGDSLAGLAAGHYGEQHRWPAIKAYNDLQRDGLWLGETILIPRLGQSGAHNNPALPHDTTDPSKDVDFGALVDPGREALDYNALVGEGSKGISFVDMPDA